MTRNLLQLVAKGKSATLELKRSTGELREALQTLCAFANGKGGRVAEVFHRAGLIEKWGRGTNRVAEMCRAAGLTTPSFEEITGAAVVTFRVAVAQARGPRSGSQLESQVESAGRSRSRAGAPSLEQKVLTLLAQGPLSRSELSRGVEQRRVSGPLLSAP